MLLVKGVTSTIPMDGDPGFREGRKASVDYSVRPRDKGSPRLTNRITRRDHYYRVFTTEIGSVPDLGLRRMQLLPPPVPYIGGRVSGDVHG